MTSAFIVISGAVVAALTAAVAYQGPSTFPSLIDKVAFQDEVPVADLMKGGALEDMTLGNPNAPNTIIEYASMTCSHCADFHKTIFSELKGKYIDTGKVRFVFRDFPLDTPAAVAAMLTRCVDKERYFALIDALFESQDSWARAKEGEAGIRLLQIFHTEGMSKEQFNRCLADKELLRKLLEVRDRARQLFGVDVTPTLFVNGKRLENVTDIEDIEALIERQENP